MERHLVLIGLSGAGKSSVGRALAARLGCPLVDLDEAIARRAGMSIEQIFEKLGEAQFRRMEATIFAETLDGPPAVIATGGGAVVNDLSRLQALDSGLVVWLRVSPERAAERCARSEVRPLIQGDPVERLRGLLERREGVYAQAHHSVETDGRSSDEVAEAIMSKLARAT
jgi:shikimate kinase